MARHLIPMIALFMSTAFLMAGGGILGILLPVRGQIEGFTSSQIGLIGAGWAIGFTLGCIVVPRLVRRVGHVRCFSVLAALLAAGILVNGLVVEPYIWGVLRAISGLCFAGSYMIIESWMNERITNESRGSVFSMYMIISQVSMMAGQYLLVTADPNSTTLFMVGAILFALAVLPTGLSRAQSPAPLTQVQLDLRKLYDNSPAAVIGAIICGVISGTWVSLAPVYGAESGMSNTGIANMVAFAMVGSIVIQYPLGRLSDFMDRRYVMIGAALLGATLGFLTSLIQVDGGHPGILFYVMMVLLGGFIYPIYALVVAHANDYADTHDFVKISSGLLILYGFGNMIGPLMTGALMEYHGANMLFTIIGIAHCLLAAFIILRVIIRSRPKVVDKVEFQTGPVAKAQTPETYAMDPRADAETYNTESEHAS